VDHDGPATLVAGFFFAYGDFMRIGLIQTGAIGDIFIAAPIAQYFIDQGHEVYWPIDSAYLGFTRAALPEINFLEISRAATGFRSFEYFVQSPLHQLKSLGCDKIIPLYSALGDRGEGIVNPTYAASLKFDEYKYAVSGVPFQRKWTLKIHRDYDREQTLYDSLNPEGRPYVLRNETAGCGTRFSIEIDKTLLGDRTLIDMTAVTDSPLDWLGVAERAAGLFLIDGLLSNLVDQLSIGQNRHLRLRSSVASTPVFASGWTFI